MTDPKTCSHTHGDQIGTLWVCGQCFSTMTERPSHYFTKPRFRFVDDFGDTPSPAHPQELRVAHVRTLKTGAEAGMTLGTFLEAMTKHLQAKAPESFPDYNSGMTYALGILKGLGDEFGDPACTWTIEDARELVEEDMTYWDCETPASN